VTITNFVMYGLQRIIACIAPEIVVGLVRREVSVATVAAERLQLEDLGVAGVRVIVDCTVPATRHTDNTARAAM